MGFKKNRTDTLTPTPLPQGEGLGRPFALREKGPGVEGWLSVLIC